MVSLFSKKKDSVQPASDVPPEFFDAVTIMGDSERDSARGKSTSEGIPQNPFSAQDSSGSPFLAKHEQEHVGEALEQQERQITQASFQKELVAEMNKNGLAPVNPIQELHIETKNNSSKRLIIMGGVFLCIALFVGAALYYYSIFKKTDIQVDDTIGYKSFQPELKEEKFQPFALDKPNYLSIDIETATANDLRTLLNDRFSKMTENNVTQPVEFIVTDQNNNPVAFSRLAYVANLEIEPNLLSFINEGFSIFVYNDAGQMRLGFFLTSKNTTALGENVIKEEAVLPYGFRTLLYDANTATPRRVTFRQGTYNTQVVRFVNIDGDKNFSFDYMVRGNEWLIGSSKNTLRAMIDKYAQ